jgi:hypothetical protein
MSASHNTIRTLAAFAAVSAPLALAAPAQAQLEPRVLIIFDTSSSMLADVGTLEDARANDPDCDNFTDDDPTNDCWYGWACGGDGSREFPHRTCSPAANTSRMFEAKRAMSRIVEQADDVEFGLMRYGQLEPDDAGYASAVVGSQYLNGDLEPVWTNYDGGSRGCTTADLLVAPDAASRDAVLTWMDGTEDYPANKELRANGFTPLTASLQSAREEIEVLAAADPRLGCRSYYVLLLTDGRQECPDQNAGDPADRPGIQAELVRQAESLRDIEVDGVRLDVRTFVVGFGPGTAFASELDVLARAGGTAVDAAGNFDPINGTAYQASDPMGLVAALQDAVGNATPRERCDGVDDDCDGRTDEDYPGLGSACSAGVGVCGRDGTIQCDAEGLDTVCSAVAGDPMAEVCDGSDNDCDGQLDEGVLNACGQCGAEPIEACNGRDDDCDGVADEGVRNACGACGAVPRDVCDGADNDCDGRTDEGVLNACGACGQPPAEVCNCMDDDCDNVIDEVPGAGCPRCDCDVTNGGVEACDGIDNDCDERIDEGALNRCGRCGDVPVEICNALDDDCDGVIDENPQGIGQNCGTNEGACMVGVSACVDGAVVCNGELTPMQESCDLVDNDCDGTVDEDAFNACGWCGAPRIEVCDNIDNDCDGQDDPAGIARCRAGETCVNGECAAPCAAGDCTDGQVCVDGACATPCYNRDCPDGLVCQQGTCADPCVGIQCPFGTYCTIGRCVADDCNGGLACAAGEMCVNGACAPDPCAAAGCAPNQGCVDGQCFESCDDVPCPDGQRCTNGVCVDDPCARVACAFPLVCEAGACVMDPCFEDECPAGEICEAGMCIDDPCNRITCPQGETCHRGECRSGNPAPVAPGGGGGDGDGDGNDGDGDPSATDDAGVTDGDATLDPEGSVTGARINEIDCSCDAGDGGAPVPFAALLLLLAGVRPRRRG